MIEGILIGFVLSMICCVLVLAGLFKGINDRHDEHTIRLRNIYDKITELTNKE